jgi:putative hydrolases of HD superfamily
MKTGLPASKTTQTEKREPSSVEVPLMRRPTAEDLSALLALKELPRSGWVQTGVAAPESVADHSWGTALLVLLLAPPSVDLGRALTMAVLHDLAEVRTGDLTPEDGVPALVRHRTEAAALQGLLGELSGGQALIAIWQAFEDGLEPEARFVRQMDKLEMGLQALRYVRSGEEGLTRQLSEFLDSARVVVTDPELRDLLEAPPTKA